MVTPKLSNPNAKEKVLELLKENVQILSADIQAALWTLHIVFLYFLFLLKGSGVTHLFSDMLLYCYSGRLEVLLHGSSPAAVFQLVRLSGLFFVFV